jgi:hypothetical protein
LNGEIAYFYSELSKMSSIPKRKRPQVAEHLIYVFENGEEWGESYEIEESEQHKDYNIVTFPNGDWVQNGIGSLFSIVLTKKEYEDVCAGLEPRKVDNYYERCTYIKTVDNDE